MLPQIDVIAAPGGVRIVENFCLWPANWLQIVENSVDQVHTGILHGEGSARADVWSQIPKVDWHPDDFGIQTVQIRGDYGRTNYLRFPTTILLNQPWPGGKFDWPRYSAIFRTPVDDNHTILFHVTHVPEKTKYHLSFRKAWSFQLPVKFRRYLNRTIEPLLPKDGLWTER